jgi:potassium efflux system protein
MKLPVRIFPIFALMLVVGIGMLPAQLKAQESSPGSSVSEKMINARIQETETMDLDDEIRQQLTENYRQAIGFIESARIASSKAEFFEQARQSAPDEAVAVREKLDAMLASQAEVTLELPDNASARDIEQRLQTEKANQAAVSAKLGTLAQQLAAESNRPQEVRQILLDAKVTVNRLAEGLKLPAPPGELSVLTESRRWVLSTHTAAANAEIRSLDQELLSQSARVDLMEAQRDLTERNLGRIAVRVALLEKALTDQRRSETEKIIAESDTSVFGEIGASPMIRDMAQRNLELSKILQMLTTQLESVEGASRAAATNLTEIEQMFQVARQRLEIVGLSQALGQALHEQRRDLPDLRQYKRQARNRSELIAEAGLRDIRLEEEWREMLNTSAYIAIRIEEAPIEERDALEEPMQKLVDVRRTLLRNTIAANTRFQRALAELDFQENRVTRTASEYDSYLIERLLWVRSKKAVGLGTVLSLPGEIFKFLNPRSWLEAIQRLLIPNSENALLGLAVLISVLIFWKTAALRRALRETAKTVGRPSDDNFVCTLRALGITILLMLPWPLLIGAAGWELSQSLDVSNDAKAIGTALLRVNFAVFFLRTLRLLCMDGGLAEAHFRWSPAVTRQLRRQVDRLFLTFILPAFVLVESISRAPADFGGELARLAFVLATAGLGIFLYRLLQPKDGILQGIRASQNYTEKMSPVWVALGTSIPVAFMLAALAGYVYSAATLMSRLIDSLWLIFGLLIVHELVARWLLVVGGRLKLKAYLERLEAARIERERAREASEAGEDIEVTDEEPELDVASIDADTRQLVNLGLMLTALIGLGGIWSSVLPALSIFQEITLWEFVDGAAGQEQLVPVTLANLLLAAVYGFVTIVSARTIPSLLEAILRHRGSTTPGSRLAFATLARYTIVLIGVSLTAGSIGFNWGKIQWLVAALSVGIGFGLQEIIANFISGLIILVERPIRVGDLVTVGDTSGTVTALQIRATTVTNFDRQELLVPNKEFITGRVLNWSLSDEVIRLVARVGVAYGSDMKKALALVREAVDEQAVVLHDPPPLITFDEFGDNSLNITARCFIGSLNKRREAISDLNLSINQKFNAAGIVVAFPQRDVHLDMASPLDVRIQEGSGVIPGTAK